MPYLLKPSQSTWDCLPVVLQPTQNQFEYAHDITISFLPIPILRNLLVQDPTDWLKHASQHDLRLGWPGSWGDVGGAALTEVGNWRQTCHSSGEQKFANVTPVVDIDDPMESLNSKMEAIVVNPSSGRRYVSQGFEQHCWASENWQFGKGILSIWPELARHAPTE